ncbi:LuxR C-terminal-related transcriptional regulator [Streptomyces sp. NPDC002611]
MIEARELTKRYGDKTVVDHLSFTVKPGEVTGFLGPNGAGKSTTMRMIVGLDAPTRGSVTVGGTAYARPEELVAGIHAVATGDAVVAPRLTRRLLDAYAHQVLAPADPPVPDPRLGALSDREREVLVAIGQGWTNAEIAERLVLSESTVKKHVGRVLAKIGARDRIQAVITAYDAGLVRAKS